MPAALGRASLVGMLLTYVALTLGVCGLSRAASCARTPAAAPAADETALWAFLGPVSPGMALGTWTIAQVDPPRGGAVLITLRPPTGPDLPLAVTRRTPDGPRPLAHTAHLALFLAEPLFKSPHRPAPAPSGSSEPDPSASPEPNPSASSQPVPSAAPKPAPSASSQPALSAAPKPAPSASLEPASSASITPPEFLAAAAALAEALAAREAAYGPPPLRPLTP